MSEKRNKIPRSRPNYFYVILSVALVLFLLGFFGGVIIQTQNLVDYFKERVNIIVELKSNSTPENKDELKVYLLQQSYLKPETFGFVSKEEGVKILSEEFGEEFLRLNLTNPLFDVVKFNVNASFLQQDSLRNMREQIGAFDYVRDIYYQETMVNEAARNIERFGYLALAISMIFVIIAITLIHNTIRLALYANRFLIKNMQLVGASWSFISRPYLWRSALHGFLSALIAIGVLAGIVFLVNTKIAGIDIIEQGWKLGLLFIGLTLLGILITTLSTYYVVNKYLKMRVDDLY